MDATTLAAGLTSQINDFTAAYGPVVLLIVGIALGLFGLKFGYAYITNWVRVRNTNKA